jgi:hypothetical protein
MLDVLFPALNQADAFLAVWLPALFRVCLWGALSGASALVIYKLTSDQAGIARLKDQARGYRQQMLDPTLEEAEFKRLVTENLRASLHLLAKVLVPSLVASIPVAAAMFWLSIFFSYQLPEPGENVAVSVIPADAEVSAVPAEALVVKDGHTGYVVGFAPKPLQIYDERGIVVYRGNPEDPPSGSVQKRKWWNWLVGSAIGYLDDDAGLEEVRWDFPRRTLMDSGPSWMTTWEFPFFFSLIVVALTIKFVFKIH